MKNDVSFAFEILSLLTAICFCGGCETLPNGNPPEGVVVNNEVRKIYQPTEAADYLATRFSLFMLENYPGRAVVCDADAETLSGALYALQESYHLAGTHQEIEAELRLHTRAENGKWFISVWKSGSPLWEETLTVKGESNE